MFDLPPVDAELVLPPLVIEIVTPSLEEPFLITQLFGRNSKEPRTIHVSKTGKIESLQEAVSKSKPGDRIELEEGDYPDTFVVIHHELTIVGLGSGARLFSDQLIPNGKAYLVSNANLTLQNIHFENAQVADRNGAGIRYQGGNLSIVDCTFSNNENGILGANDRDGQILIQGSTFKQNGYGDGYTHAIYIAKIDSLSVENSHFFATRAGHHIKSRAKRTRVENSFLDDGTSDTSYSIDLPNGGENFVVNNIMIQSANPGNPAFVNFGSRLTHTDNYLEIRGNTFVNHFSSGAGVNNHTEEVVLITRNSLYNVSKVNSGKASVELNEASSDVPTTESLFEIWQDQEN